MSKVTLTPDTFVSNLNLLRLRFMDMHRDLIELTNGAVEEGFLGDHEKITLNSLVTDGIYDTIFELGEAVGNDFEANPWDDIQDNKGLSLLIVEEFSQANEKVVELGARAKLDEATSLQLMETTGWLDYSLNVQEILDNKDLQDLIKADFEKGYANADGTITRKYTDYAIKGITFGEDSTVYAVFYFFDEVVELGGSTLPGYSEAYIIS
ncbi:MAG: hypothetical protein ACRC6V_00670 [Bacteroidales bacterium]